MNTKVQELAEKLYHEGVERGNAEAESIVSAAKNQAADIVAQAQEEAAAILAAAQKNAQELDTNTRTELKQYASQSVNALKSEIVNVVCASVLKETVANAVKDDNVIGELLVNLASKWSDGEGMIIESAEAEKLTKYFAAHAKALLDKGVTINQVNGLKTLVTVKPADGSYKLEFGNDEFEKYFKGFLRPQLIEMLF